MTAILGPAPRTESTAARENFGEIASLGRWADQPLQYEHMFDPLTVLEEAVDKVAASESPVDIARMRAAIERLEHAWLERVRDAENGAASGWPRGT